MTLEEKGRKLRESACLDEMADELERRATKDWSDAESWCLFFRDRCRFRSAEIVEELGGKAALMSLMEELGYE